MSIANWKTQVYNRIQSLLFNNPHRVVSYRVRAEDGKWVDRAETKAPVRRLFETETPPDRTCLRTIQFVHHVLIPPHASHVEELHIHPDAEEIVVITQGHGQAIIEGKTSAVAAGDVIHVAPGAEHEVRNTSEEILGALFINVPTGDGLLKVIEVQGR